MDGPNPRIIKEVQRNMEEPLPGVTKFEPDPENFRHFLLEIEGPEESLYAGGKFKLQMQLDRHYPFKPPKMNFKTTIYHPYIDSVHGLICLKMLDRQFWTPVMNIRTVLAEIINLLCNPDEKGNYNPTAALHWMQNKKEAEKKAREYTKKYATQS